MYNGLMSRERRTRPRSPSHLEASRFLMKEGQVYETLRRLATRLEEEGLSYAIIGGMAVVEHGSRRTTEDINVVIGNWAKPDAWSQIECFLCRKA